MVSTPTVCRAFVGRSDELAHLVARRRAASDGKGGLAVVGGEPGIGKSRLLAEFMQRSAYGTARLVRVECRQFAQSPLGPLDDALVALGADMRPIRGAPTTEARLTALLRAFADAAERRTTIVAVEDLHWADAELVGTLRLLAARATSQRLLIVATYRDNEMIAGHPAYVAFGGLLREPSVSRLVLTAFEPAPMVELLTQAAAGVDVARAVVRDVARRAEGNPLYGEELLRHAVDGVRRPGAMPISLDAVVRERLGQCSENERAVLAAAALCGRRFDLDLVAQVLGIDGGVPAHDIGRLVDLQLVRPVAHGAGHYEFRHALTRDAIVADRAADERKPVHARIARALAERPDAQSYALEIAHHRWESDARDAGAPAYENAAQVARALLAWDDAALWYRRAIAAAAEHPAEVARLNLELGKLLILAYREDEAAAAFVRAAEIALSLGDVALVVRTRRVHAGMMANNGRREAAIALLERTLPLVPGDDRRMRNEIVIRIAAYHLMKQTTDDARAWIDRIDADAIDPNDAAAAEFFTLRGVLRAKEPHDAGWIDDFDRALAVYRRTGAAMFERYLLAERGMQAIGRGDLAFARASFERAREASTESASTRNDVPLGMAMADLYGGRLVSAATWLARVEPSEMLHARMLQSVVGVSLGVALADDALVRTHLVPALLEDLAAHDEEYGFVRLACAYADALVVLERPADADALLERAAARIASAVGMQPSMATIAALRPDLAAPFEAVLAVRAGEPFHDALLALIRAERARAAGDAVTARDRGRDARAGLAACGWTILAARAADVAGDVGDAFALYREAGHVRGTRRLARASLDADTTASLAVLTARERELARKIAAGKSNRTIALEMALSTKTVEKYLTAIYGKLSLQSRAQLAAYVLRDGTAAGTQT